LRYEDKLKWTPKLADEIVRRWIGGESWWSIAREYRRDAPGLRKSALRYTTLQFDPEIVRQNVRLAKQSQGLTDVQRIERKAFREHARVENAIAAYDKEIIRLLGEHRIAVRPPKLPAPKKGDAEGIVHVSDVHFNELIDLPCNQFCFNVAAKRMRKFALEAIRLFDAYGVKRVLIALTGDILNSDRRIDELLSQSTNRASALFLAVRILHQFLLDFAGKYAVSVASVTGNESRMAENIAWSKLAAQDNYDITAFNVLELLFPDGAVKFLRGDDPNEQVVPVNGRNILLLHGTKIGKDAEAEVGKIVGRYARRGVIIHYVLFGHLHTAFLSDYFARSGSLPGANAYSEEGLNLSSRASQNCYIVNGGIHAIKIDLQDADAEGVVGYDIVDALAKYAPKAPELLHPGKEILKVVV